MTCGHVAVSQQNFRATSTTPSPTDIYRCSKPVNIPIQLLFYILCKRELCSNEFSDPPQFNLFPGARCPSAHPCQLAFLCLEVSWTLSFLYKGTKADNSPRAQGILGTGAAVIVNLWSLKFIASLHPHLRRSMPYYKRTGTDWPEIAQENLVWDFSRSRSKNIFSFAFWSVERWPMRLGCLRDRNARMSSVMGSYRESGLRAGVVGILGGISVCTVWV